MARNRRAANTTTAPPENPPPSSFTLDNFDAEASLLALQKHVDAASSANVAANGPVDTDIPDAPTQPVSVLDSAAAAAAAALASQQQQQQQQQHQLSTGNSYAASAARLLARSNNPAAVEPDLEAQIHPDLRSAHAALQQQQQQQQQPQQPSSSSSSSVQPSYLAPAPSAQAIMSSAVQQQAPQPVSVLAPALPQAPTAASLQQQQQQQQQQQPAGGSPEPAVTDGRKGPRRELSQSKRAAQNRAAQRAFRQRKEGYIKKLEQQVQDYADMENQFKLIQSENYALREYIIHLQSKLLDAKADLPQPPPNLNLAAPGTVSVGLGVGPATSASAAAASLLANAAAAAVKQQQQHHQQQQPQPLLTTAAGAAPPSAPAGTVDDTPLARVAQAVAQLGNGNENNGDGNENGGDVKSDEPDANATTDGGAGGGDPMDTSAEEIDRQLQTKTEPLAAAVASM
ncbi:bzip transcription factor [Niveomyces insectorum RCEF 264]|uniref:Putative transcription factor kapC n=1 Tax=Niveomyces insectorum RCEF 264 TaxID=1081102 RepID=A0A162MMU1_9HYPO|nr:bzip transcription factor [Niveomyces insectorum RCEF 264]